MDTYFITVIVSLFTTVFVIHKLFRRNTIKKLPPGPSFITSNYLLLTNPILQFEPVLKNLKTIYGPFFTLSTSFGPAIFISDHSLAHQVLIQNGAVFSDRPKSFPMRNISSSSYGPTWRLFRKNLASEFMHPSRIRSYSWARKWVLQVFFGRILDCQNEGNGMIKVVDHIRYAMFCLLVLMCFGERFEESRINEIARVQKDMLLKVSSGRFGVFNVFPRLGKILFRKRWKEFEKLCSDKEDVLIPLIKSRIESDGNGIRNVAYVDTLVNLELPEEEGGNGNGGKMNYKDMVSMCSEFFNSGTDTTSTALQWIMANLVKHPYIQRKLYDEIVLVVGAPPPPPSPRKGVERELELVINDEDIEKVISEEDIEKMPYLKAVVLEGLRRHPPVHFVLPHRVMKEVEVQGYRIPEGASINFMVGEMGLDPKVWDEPMEFRPERFLVNDGVFDVSGSKGIKMMPFGVGRRMCPGYDLAFFHLQYFVANSIWYFNWSVSDGYDVDLSEEVELTVVMKNPLRAQVSSRAKKRIIT